MPLIVQIRQHQFDIFREYTEGHVCTAGEAMALNQALVENVRNRLYPMIAKEVDRHRILSATQHLALQAKINSYVAAYQFRSRPTYRPSTPLESATKELAVQEARLWAHQEGLDLTGPEAKAKFAALCQDASLIDRARELVRSRQGVANDLLEGLI